MLRIIQELITCQLPLFSYKAEERGPKLIEDDQTEIKVEIAFLHVFQGTSGQCLVLLMWATLEIPCAPQY